MADDLTISGSHALGERSAPLPARIEEALAVDSFAGKIEVRWAPDEAVAPLGQLPFFVDFLKVANLFDPFVAEAPPAYASPNKPQVRNLLGTLLLSVLAGAKRYAHVNALRHDGVNPACSACPGCAVRIRCVAESPGWTSSGCAAIWAMSCARCRKSCRSSTSTRR